MYQEILNPTLQILIRGCLLYLHRIAPNMIVIVYVLILQFQFKHFLQNTPLIYMCTVSCKVMQKIM